MDLEKDITKILKNPIWRELQGGTFITTYFNKPLTSENVWCCMSNGIYDRSHTVYENAIKSSQICKKDSRTRRSQKYKYAEVSVLLPKDKWIKSSIKNLNEDNEYTIHIVDNNNDRGAFYLPSVWEENPNWTAEDLIESLKEKAGISSNRFTIYKVPTIIVNSESIYDPHDMLKPEIINIILDKVDVYYTKLIKDNKLPYIIEDDKVVYESKSLVRTLYDLASYNRLKGRKLGGEYINREDYNLHELVAVTELAKSIGSSKVSYFIKKILSYNNNGRFSDDLSFENPQAMLTVSTVIDEKSALIFVKDAHKWKGDSFGANWMSQALSSLYSRFKWKKIEDLLINKFLPILIKGFEDNVSVTQTTTALHGILSIEKAMDKYIIEEDTKLRYIKDMYKLQLEWKNGPFRYYINENWYRTDVTFHVVDVLKLMI